MCSLVTLLFSTVFFSMKWKTHHILFFESKSLLQNTLHTLTAAVQHQYQLLCCQLELTSAGDYQQSTIATYKLVLVVCKQCEQLAALTSQHCCTEYLCVLRSTSKCASIIIVRYQYRQYGNLHAPSFKISREF